MIIWPLTAPPARSVGGVGLTEIAERFGYPAYVLDEEHVRLRCREYSRETNEDLQCRDVG